ncbi:hypothetical protein D3C71_2208500 [compost metagenome]
MGKDRHTGLILHPGDKALAATRNDDVDCTTKSGQHGADGRTVGDRHHLDRMHWKPGIL